MADQCPDSGSGTGFYVPIGSTDPGWNYGYLLSKDDPTTVCCRLCQKIIKGGINRLKQHLAHVKGNVISCPKVDEDTKKLISEYMGEKTKKKERKAHEMYELRAEVNIDSSSTPRESKKAKTIESNDDTIMLEKGKIIRQSTIKDSFCKEERERVLSYLCKWAYVANIPFNAFQSKECAKAIEAIGKYGPGLTPPSRYEMTIPFLKKAVQEVDAELDVHRHTWKSSGCSIMTDSWTDIRGRSIMNLCINSKIGTAFLRSVDSSAEAHTGEYIFNLVDKCIEEVGKDSVVQVVTDNASANMAAGRLLGGKYPQIFWTSCAAHTIDLVLEEIGKDSKVKGAISKARYLTSFIYSHTRTLSIMRKYTEKKDIVRPGQTRFATAYLTLQSILDKKEKLRVMFSSHEWTSCRWHDTNEGERAASTVMSTTFWSQVVLSLRIFAPLVRMLRLVDADNKPSMGFVYGCLQETKAEIIDYCNGNQISPKPFLDAIELKTKGRLDTPLHLAAYYLNPFYYYTKNLETNAFVKLGFINCMEKFYVDLDIQDAVMRKELPLYQLSQGLFGRSLAIRHRNVRDEFSDPANWWSSYGLETPHLQHMAMRILDLTSSSSGCERNWSAFGAVNTQNRARLDPKRVNDLVYVRFNTLIKERKEAGKIDPLSSKDSLYAKAWMSNVSCEEEEVFPGSSLTWAMVANASGAEDALQPRRSKRGQSSSFLPMLNEEASLDVDVEEDDDEDVEPILLDDDE